MKALLSLRSSVFIKGLRTAFLRLLSRLFESLPQELEGLGCGSLPFAQKGEASVLGQFSVRRIGGASIEELPGRLQLGEEIVKLLSRPPGATGF